MEDPEPAYGATSSRDAEELEYAQSRLPGRTYLSKSFPLNRPASSDHGEPARFIHKVFDAESETTVELEGSDWVIRETPGGRYQVRLLVTREAGNVKELWIQRIPMGPTAQKAECKLHLVQPDVGRLIDLVKLLDHLPAEGTDTVRIDDTLVRQMLANPESLARLYQKDPQKFQQLITDDESARDVVAMAHRRAQVAKFRRLLSDEEYFAEEVRNDSGNGEEAVWQHFFEQNPWIFGVSLTGQLLTSWSTDKLEQVVVGRSNSSPGKRVDALLTTSGRIRSLVFAEIKTHKQPLLGTEYRPGCWAPSHFLTDGIAQAQGTVHLAAEQIGKRLQDKAADGSDIPGEYAHLIRPRTFLVIGNLDQMLGSHGGHHEDRFRSFELFRRQLIEPEVLTFDELLARAEWSIATS